MASCAMVLWFDKPFADLDPSFGLTKSAEIRMKTNPSEDVYVLVPRGFSNMEPRTVDRLRELRYRVVDVAPLLAAVRAEYPFANEARLWHNDPFHEMCFLRHLIMEKYFGDSPVLAMDNDVVWRVDPYELLKSWVTGGSFLCFGSACLILIKGKSWYDSYREGFEKLAGDKDFGKDFSKEDFSGLYHDQALCQFLVRTRSMESDHANFIGHGFQEKYKMFANPLNISGDAPLTFAQTPHAELIGDKIIPFWHMQSSFSRYLALALLVPRLTGKDHLRIPFERKKTGASTDLGAEILPPPPVDFEGNATFNTPKLRDARELTYRRYLYEQFFERDLARHVFREAIWWRPGVWAQ